MDVRSHFEGKKVTVMGLGLLGRGIGDARFLAENGAEVVVTDLKSAEELKASVAELADFPNVSFVLGEHRMEDFEGKDFILKAAGVPLDSPYIAHARENNIPIEMSASLFARISGVPIIAVTGTRGKSTVTHMIHHVLSQVTEGAPVLLGGNVRGVSNLQLFKEANEDSIAVMELDSWQLQGFGEARISPHIAVFTNFMDDHLNYYRKGTANDEEAVEAYFADKANIFLYQEESDVFVTTPAVFEQAKRFAAGKKITLGQEVVLADASLLPDDCLLSMPGEHNRLNAALAYSALKATSLSDEEIFEGLASFPGVPGRLEFMGEFDIPEKEGTVRIYNDNNATTPSATLAGLRALTEDGNHNIILIMGGADKQLPFGELLEALPMHAKRVILLPGTGTDTIKDKVEGIVVANLEEAVNTALKESEAGDRILFSPAFASFGMFKNEYDRGDQFVEIVSKL